uniref:Uncharacterized protein n=1 Tax=Knipowitschia caucasica TaxID=637954 RepID=A0AAV2KCM2_KNICA
MDGCELTLCRLPVPYGNAHFVLCSSLAIHATHRLGMRSSAYVSVSSRAPPRSQTHAMTQSGRMTCHTPQSPVITADDTHCAADSHGALIISCARDATWALLTERQRNRCHPTLRCLLYTSLSPTLRRQCKEEV